MRHGKKINHLSRKSAHRKAMLSNMATSLIMHKRITTTLAKAKALRVYVEPIITRSKEDTTHSRRVVFSYLQSKEAVTELFRDVSAKVADRPGGYTRIIKLGLRLGDNAEMAMIELVDFNLNLLGDKAPAKAKTTRRSRRGGAKKAGAEEVADTAAAPAKPAKAKAKKEEEPVAVAAPAPQSVPAEMPEPEAEPDMVADAEPPAEEILPEEAQPADEAKPEDPEPEEETKA
ncbi:MAG: 50S ribosomal protein L17 [Bacteroidales bacterium]|jgi:large subunit ribosomal protein L17|nr:50S ribosomal protein L17 [Bacteroidales bacterium]